MKTFTIGSALLSLATLSCAAPGSAPIKARQQYGSITFEGAADASYTLNVPFDGSTFDICRSIPVSLADAATAMPTVFSPCICP